MKPSQVTQNDKPAQQFRREGNAALVSSCEAPAFSESLSNLMSLRMLRRSTLTTVCDQPSYECEDQHDDETRKVVGETPGKVLHRLRQFADNHFPHSCLTLFDFHISSRYGFNRSNSRHKPSILFSTSLAEPLRFSTRNVNALPRKSGASAWII